MPGLPPISLLTDALPMGYVVKPFAQEDELSFCFETVLQQLQQDEDSNQWIILAALGETTIERMIDPETPWEGLGYRLQWNQQIGLLKVIADSSHVMITEQLARAIDHHISAMQSPIMTHRWIANVAYRPTPTEGKQADEAFVPPSRYSTNPQIPICPTLVIETGVPFSLYRLRNDAKWWFAQSKGDVRIVLIVTISSVKIRIEKWQLAPPDAPSPLFFEYVESLRLQNPPMPPLAQQLSAVQQPYRAQRVEVSSHGVVSGAPLIIPYAALFDQAPGPGEGDIVLGADDIRAITSGLF